MKNHKYLDPKNNYIQNNESQFQAYEKILKEYEINNFKNLISEHYESIKMLDLKNFLSQDIKIQNQKKIPTERTPSIFRQVSLYLKTFDYS